MITTAGEPVRPATATGPGRATADTPHPEVALLSNGSYGAVSYTHLTLPTILLV